MNYRIFGLNFNSDDKQLTNKSERICHKSNILRIVLDYNSYYK